jgi:hypothetical protein
MATTLDITTTYQGEFAGKYISAALLSANTLQNNGITPMMNVKYRQMVKTFSATDLIKNASCDFNATGTITLGERWLEPKELDVNVLLCKKDFRSDWEAISMGYSAFDVLPKTFQDYMISQMLGKVAEATERSIWHGDDAVNGEFTGIVTSGLGIGGVTNTIAGTVIDATNVKDEIGSVVDAINPELYGTEGLKIFIPQNVARAYVRALGGFGSGGYGANGTNAQGTQWYNMGSGLSFDGIPLFVANGLQSNYMVAAQTENLYFGTGILNDQLEVAIIDMAKIDGSQNVRFVMRYTAGTQIGITDDVVIYYPD